MMKVKSNYLAEDLVYNTSEQEMPVINSIDDMMNVTDEVDDCMWFGRQLSKIEKNEEQIDTIKQAQAVIKTYFLERGLYYEDIPLDRYSFVDKMGIFSGGYIPKFNRIFLREEEKPNLHTIVHETIHFLSAVDQNVQGNGSGRKMGFDKQYKKKNGTTTRAFTFLNEGMTEKMTREVMKASGMAENEAGSEKSHIDAVLAKSDKAQAIQAEIKKYKEDNNITSMEDFFNSDEGADKMWDLLSKAMSTLIEAGVNLGPAYDKNIEILDMVIDGFAYRKLVENDEKGEENFWEYRKELWLKMQKDYMKGNMMWMRKINAMYFPEYVRALSKIDTIDLSSEDGESSKILAVVRDVTKRLNDAFKEKLL